MALKKYKPTTAGQRHLVLVDRSDLWKGRPEKTLVEGKTKSGGRNNQGRITVRHRGGGHKQLYRKVDFRRRSEDLFTVVRLEYDPNRTAFIALVENEKNEKSYILAPQKLAVGDKIQSAPNAEIKVGNALPLGKIPVGSIIHNIELKPGKGAQLVRSAGSFAQIMGREGNKVQIRMTSGELRLVLSECYATLGAVSNPDHSNVSLGKAGRKRWMGIRPTVRGTVMNPIDHPHGGGEGKSRGRHPVSPTGKPTKGAKTRKNKRTNNMIIRRRNQTKGR